MCKCKIESTEKAKEEEKKKKEKKKAVSLREEEHILRQGVRFGRGDICFPRGTTTFHQNTAKMLFRPSSVCTLLSCQ